MHRIANLVFAATLAPALAGAVPALAQTAGEVWVLNQGSRNISIVDPTLASVIATVDISDPDGNGSPDTPTCLAFSTVPGSMGTHTFVTQGSLVSVVRVATRLVTAVDVAALDPALSRLKLAGCAAAHPRRFVTATGNVRRNHLFVAGNLPNVGAVFLVLDQQALITGSGAVLVDWGVLYASGVAVDVTALETPAGDRLQRAWFTVSRSAPSPALLALRVTTDAAGQAFQVDVTRSLAPGSLVAPARLRLGAPPDRELPIFPGPTSAVLTNLDNGATCGFGGAPNGVLVAGPGNDSYTAFVLDDTGSVVLVVDPRDCSFEAVTVGLAPVAIAVDDRFGWSVAWIANSASNTVARLDRDGTVTPIPLGSLAIHPIDVGLSGKSGCNVTELRLERVVGDGDGLRNDIAMNWKGDDCPPDVQYDIRCRCRDADPDCPCYCDCEFPSITPGCECPGLDLGLAARGPGPAMSLQAEPIVQISGTNPMKMLGLTADEDFVVSDIEDLHDLQLTVNPVFP